MNIREGGGCCGVKSWWVGVCGFVNEHQGRRWVLWGKKLVGGGLWVLWGKKLVGGGLWVLCRAPWVLWSKKLVGGGLWVLWRDPWGAVGL
jgi:hypothetical protein